MRKQRSRVKTELLERTGRGRCVRAQGHSDAVFHPTCRQGYPLAGWGAEKQMWALRAYSHP